MDFFLAIDIFFTALMAVSAVKLYTGHAFAQWDYVLAAIIGAYAIPWAFQHWLPDIDDSLIGYVFALVSSFGGALVGCIARGLLPGA